MKYIYLIRIMSLTSVICFIYQEITKGLSNSPLAIIYKLFHYMQSLLLHFGYYLQP